MADLFGRATEIERVGVIRWIPLVGLDALSSVAYGPEALLTVLIPIGAAGLHYLLPLTLAIVALLTALSLSYRQTIEAYPNGGGSYTVARENLGRGPSLVAAAALVLDYLNVAVAISAGVGAVVSAAPALLKYTLPLCLVLLLVLANLRGVRSSGGAFAVPTYAFVIAVLAIIGIGLARAAGACSETAAAAPRAPSAGQVTAWLLLRAFANGCTAVTGARAWRLYLAGSAVAFRRGRIGVYQVLLAKRGRSAEATGLPRCRGDWYERLRRAARRAEAV